MLYVLLEEKLFMPNTCFNNGKIKNGIFEHGKNESEIEFVLMRKKHGQFP